MTTMYRGIFGTLVLIAALAINVSCLNNDDRTILLNNGLSQSGDNTTTPPSEVELTPNPEVDGPYTVEIPDIQHYVDDVNGKKHLITFMPGIVHDGEVVRLVGTSGGENQNLWASIDGVPKVVSAYNTIDGTGGEYTQKYDIVLLVDNSENMADEADVLVAKVVEWAEELTKDYNVQFGVVGYNGMITGALDLAECDALVEYLNREGVEGIGRTKGFEGDSGVDLGSAAVGYNDMLYANYECCMAALLFADEFFAFRADSNRIYVNFTDEYNNYFALKKFSVEYLRQSWSVNQGVVHTIFSGSTESMDDGGEEPWLMSTYTGGKTIFTNSKFSVLSLYDDIPIGEALQNSYVIRVEDVGEFMDGVSHNLLFTVKSPDNLIRSEREFKIKIK
jgi:hypothetical protein